MNDQEQLREHVLELLRGRSAHISLEEALNGFPVAMINQRPAGSPHSAWELLEHLRIAQWDILEFSRNAQHVSPEFPDGYWPKEDGTVQNWNESVRQLLDELRELSDLVADTSTDLFVPIPHGDGQTVLREALVAADHNAYHLGQIMLLRKMLEASLTAKVG